MQSPNTAGRRNSATAGLAVVLVVILLWSSSVKPPPSIKPAAFTDDPHEAPANPRSKDIVHQHYQRQTSMSGRGQSRETPLEQIAKGTFHGDWSARGEYGWRFKVYVPSKLEEDFLQDVKPHVDDVDWPTLASAYTARVDNLVQASAGFVAPDLAFKDDASFAQDCDAYLNTTARGDIVGAGRTCLGRQDPLNPALFSRFIYEFVCLEEPCLDGVPAGYQIGEEHTSYIEPLFGLMRHPMFFSLGGASAFIYRKDYMIVDKWALHHLHTRWKTVGDKKKSFFVDMGASLYTAGLGGASQNWFVGIANCLCVPFTDMHLFEAVPHASNATWKSVPDYLHPHYRWYNYPLSTDERSWRNPLNHYLQKKAHGDVVIMKVDFDSPGLESKIINTILTTSELYNSIDELFYEYHVKMPHMRKYWKNKIDRNATVRTSIEVFQALRRRGIRAHSWV